MFPLRDDTRRRIGLAAFFGLCVIPTLLVLGFGLSRHVPGHVRAEAARLTWQLGQKVSIDRVRHLRPGAVRYEGLELLNPQTGRPVLRCRTLHASWKERTDPQGKGRPYLALVAGHTRIEAAEFRQLWPLLEGVLVQSAGGSAADVRLAAGEAVLGLGETTQTLTGLEGTIERLQTQAQVDVFFRLDTIETPQPVWIHAKRDHQTDRPATGIGIHTRGALLPCSLLANALPQLSALGPKSRFRGYLWLIQTSEGWGGDLAGQFHDVDLDRLVAGHFEHSLSGSGQLGELEARFRRGRIEEASGWLLAGPGLVSRSLLDAALEHLGMVRGWAPQAPGGLVPYQRLALSFRIDSEGVRLGGPPPPEDSGTIPILSGREGVLLGQLVPRPLPVAAVIQALLPRDADQVPATRQAGWLMSRLPLPAVASPMKAEAEVATRSPQSESLGRPR